MQKKNILTDDVYEEYKEVFFSYLEKNSLNKTVERIAIMREVYEIRTLFTVEMLYERLMRKKYHISRATFYHTLDILQDCKLVQKHQFGNGAAMFELAYGVNSHAHILLPNNEVLDYDDPRIDEMIAEVEKKFGIKIYKSSFTLYAKGEE